MKNIFNCRLGVIKKKSKKLYFILFIILLTSCNSSTKNKEGQEHLYASNDSIFHVSPTLDRIIKFNSNQQIEEIGWYRNSIKTSTWREYKNGNIVSATIYKNGKEISNSIDIDDYNFKREILRNTFSINIPVNWNVIKDSAYDLVIVKADTTKEYNTNCIIKRNIISCSIDEYVKQYLQQLSKVNIPHKVFGASKIGEKVVVISINEYYKSTVLNNYVFLCFCGEECYEVVFSTLDAGINFAPNFIDLFYEMIFSSTYNGKSLL